MKDKPQLLIELRLSEQTARWLYNVLDVCVPWSVERDTLMRFIAAESDRVRRQNARFN